MQLYERRKKVLKTAKEKKKFQQIDYQYMTEESMSEGDNDVVRTHKLPWRSDSKISDTKYLAITLMIGLVLIELNDFIETLDSRIKKSKADSHHTSGGFSLKSRVESVLSTSSPPADAPPWSIRSLDDSTATQEASGSTVQPSLEHELDEPNTSSSETDAHKSSTETPSRARVSNQQCRKRLTTEGVHEALSEGSGFDFSNSDLD